MHARWFTLALLPVISLQLRAQGNTPQAALEELATTTKPEIIARHLPEPLQKSIEVLPKAAREKMLNEILKLKKLELDGCTVRRNDDSDSWDIISDDGETKGRVRLPNAFISGVEAILPLEIETDGDPQVFIVSMHLEGGEWRLDDFGPWEKKDPGLAKLLHVPSETEKNEEAALETLRRLIGMLSVYAQRFPTEGYPSSLRALTVPLKHGPPAFRLPLLDESFAAEPLIKDGYQFRFIRTDLGDGTDKNAGSFEITATAVDFGRTGSRNYFVNESGVIRSTTENRAATGNDPRLSNDPGLVVLD